ncbi:MAG TPA: 30S ribosomal protein S21 [Ktedonobacteraceae bacterium]|nr:30S ribosomal protein S21 [Ktedonobacteraceae bacterium]
MPKLLAQPGDAVEGVLTRFSRKVQEAGLLAQARRRRQYESPPARRKRRRAR